MVSARDLGLLEFAADGADAWAILKQAGIGGGGRRRPFAVNNLPLGGT